MHGGIARRRVTHPRGLDLKILEFFKRNIFWALCCTQTFGSQAVAPHSSTTLDGARGHGGRFPSASPPPPPCPAGPGTYRGGWGFSDPHKGSGPRLLLPLPHRGLIRRVRPLESVRKRRKNPPSFPPGRTRMYGALFDLRAAFPPGAFGRLLLVRGGGGVAYGPLLRGWLMLHREGGGSTKNFVYLKSTSNFGPL